MTTVGNIYVSQVESLLCIGSAVNVNDVYSFEEKQLRNVAR